MMGVYYPDNQTTNAANTDTFAYVPNYPYQPLPTYYPPHTEAELREVFSQRQKQKQEENPVSVYNRGLFEVFIVDPKKDSIVFSTTLIAKDDGSAKLKAVAKAALDNDVDDYDFIVRRVGDVRAKKETQKVEIVTPSSI